MVLLLLSLCSIAGFWQLQRANVQAPPPFMQAVKTLENHTLGAARTASPDTSIAQSVPFIWTLPQRLKEEVVLEYTLVSQQEFLYITDKSLLWYPAEKGLQLLQFSAFTTSGKSIPLQYTVLVE
jgi:hypothetical protein